LFADTKSFDVLPNPLALLGSTTVPAIRLSLEDFAAIILLHLAFEASTG